MQELNQRIYLDKLFSIYQSQLTSKQIEIFINYYEEDLSINEICDLLNITKNGVYNSLKSTESKLLKLETQLQIYSRWKNNCELLKKNDVADEIINQIK